MPKTVRVTDLEAFSEAKALVSRSDFYKVSEKEVRVDRDGNLVWGDVVFEPQGASDENFFLRETEEKRPLSERFQTLYDKSVGEDSSWPVFVEELVSSFYQKCSLLIYEPIQSEQAGDSYVGVLASALRILAKNPDIRFRAERTEGVAEKICIASVKLRLDFGGAPIPTVVPFYFKLKEDGKYVEQLPPDRSRSLHRQVSELAKRHSADRASAETKKSSDYRGDYGALVAAVTAELQKTLGSPDGFGDYLILEGEARSKAADYCIDQQKLSDSEGGDGRLRRLEALTKKARDTGLSAKEEDEVLRLSDAAEFVAAGAQLRYVAILDCVCPSYALYDEDDPFGNKRYDVSFDLAWKASVRCGRCGEELISENLFKASGREIVIDLNAEQPISDEDSAFLETHDSEFSKHARKKVCEWVGGRCEELVCDRELVRCDRCTEEFAFCKNCPHPEVVYSVKENGDYVPYHTEHLVFCRDTFTLLPKERTNRCRVCGRTYSDEYLPERNGVCKFCEPLVKGAKDETRFRNLYREHRNMLPYWKRWNKKNLCNEDDAMILFRTGDLLYKFDKNSAKDGGFLKLVKVLPRAEGEKGGNE